MCILTEILISGMISPQSTHRSDAKSGSACRISMYDLSRFGRIFMMDFTAGSSLVFETGMCRKRWWYLVEYGTEHLILCAGVMVCAWTDLKYGKVRNYWLWLLTAAGVLHRGSAFFFRCSIISGSRNVPVPFSCYGRRGW